ncbi:unnamed protein product [marine sediment metagenome]|uniref:Uncharacterized protein n=1 Tax=marine sediment metagenome TaxID=412755 RepID=X1J581_9ZZZZ
MTEPIDKTLAKWGKETEELKLPTSFTICGCRGRVVTTEDGKRHFELECKDKKAREEVAAIFEEEVTLRVNPKVVLVEPPVAEPVAEPK